VRVHSSYVYTCICTTQPATQGKTPSLGLAQPAVIPLPLPNLGMHLMNGLLVWLEELRSSQPVSAEATARIGITQSSPQLAASADQRLGRETGDRATGHAPQGERATGSQEISLLLVRGRQWTVT
jgi:hypothetical protein